MLALAAVLGYLLLSGPGIGEAGPRKCLGKRATIVGGPKSQVLRGTRRADVIWGGGGRDVIRGRGGNDRLCGARGPDRLLGAAGRDRLDGGVRNDVLLGGAGPDRLQGGKGRDTCNLGSETTLDFSSCERFPLTVTGRVVFDTGGGAAPSRVRVDATHALAASPLVSANASGNYKASLIATRLPTALTASVTHQPPGLPSVRTAREATARSNTPGLANSVVPNVATAELALSGGAASSADGSVEVAGAPPEVARLFARAYNPAGSAGVFPATFEDTGEIPLNSSVFVWIAALDSAGNPVHNLSAPMTIRSRVPGNQLKDLVDLEAGTDRIELPVYRFDETVNLWKQDGTGWLEDAAGGLVPEDAQQEVIDGTFPGELYSIQETDHLSWVNLDYPFFGPWDISSTEPQERNECLVPALDLANTIILSQPGFDALMPLNKPGADLKSELANGVIKLVVEPPPPTVDPDAYGWFDPAKPGEIHLRQSLVDFCSLGPGQKLPPLTQKSMTVYLAAVIVHEVAHWKFYNKHEGGNQDESEPGGHAGSVVDEELWNGILSFYVNSQGRIALKLNGVPVPESQLDSWLSSGFWPPAPSSAGAGPTAASSPAAAASPLAVSISLPKSNFELGEQITATVTYQNASAQPIKVLDLGLLEGLPLWFEFKKQGQTARVPFLGARVRPNVDFDQDFVTLGSGQSVQRSFDLIEAADGSTLYNLVSSGNYTLTAHYSGLWGIEGAQSIPLDLSVNPGGSVSGTVVDETTNLPLDDVRIRALQGQQIRAEVTTDSNGDYTIPELPADTYAIEAKALGYLKDTEQNVVVTNGLTTTVDLAVAPLVASDGVRLVLTWNPLAGDDLDSHLWLPPAKPYHLAFFRLGDLSQCPFAELDVDVISQGGPETTTIGQLFSGDYLYAVNRFSGPTDLSQSGAQVKLYDSGGDLLDTYDVPTSGTDDWWELLRIDGDTGQVTEVNTLGADPEPYSDTSSGCP